MIKSERTISSPSGKLANWAACRTASGPIQVSASTLFSHLNQPLRSASSTRNAIAGKRMTKS
jgi:hypothetical protein